MNIAQFWYKWNSALALDSTLTAKMYTDLQELCNAYKAVGRREVEAIERRNEESRKRTEDLGKGAQL